MRDDESRGVAFALWVLVPVLLASVPSRLVYLLPLIPWLVLTTLAAADRSLMDGWHSAWFLDLGLLCFLEVVVLAAMRTLGRPREKTGDS